MSKKVRITQFTKPETISKFRKEYLLTFLGKFDDFLGHHNIDVDNSENLAGNIAEAILKDVNSDNGLDRASDIISALQDISEMSNNHNYVTLLREAKSMNLALPNKLGDAEVSNEDCAIYFWVYHHNFFATIYAKHRIKNYQSFLYFVGKEQKERGFPEINDDIINQCQLALNIWLKENGRVENPRIYHFIHNDRLTIIIKYGMPLVRDSSIGKDGKAKDVFFNPPQNDILIYHRKYDEISLNTPNIKEQDNIYLEIIGQYLFGNKEYFEAKKEFSLKLLEDLMIEDYFGTSSVYNAKLIELTYDHGFETEIRRSSNLVPSLVKRNKKTENAKSYRIVSAKFNLTFNNKRKSKRVLTIENGNKAKMDRSEDGLIIEDWIRERGFLKFIDKDTLVTFWDKLMRLNMDSTSRAYLLRLFTEEEIDQYFVASEIETEQYPCDDIHRNCSREIRHNTNGELLLVCSQMPHGCSIIEDFDHRDLLICSINFKALADDIRCKWSDNIIKNDFKVISEDKSLYRVGFYNPKGDIGFPVYFHIPFYDGAYQEALDILLSEDDGYIFLMPSIGFLSLDTKEDKKRNKKSIITGLNRYTAEAKFKDFNELHERNVKLLPRLFPTPPNVKWEKFIFELHEEQLLNDNRTKKAHKREVIVVKCGQEEVRYEPADFKMLNEKTKEPNLQWSLLVQFIVNNGVIKWGGDGAKDNVKSQKKQLIKTLKEVFWQTEDPIPYIENEGYKCRFICRVIKN